MTTSDVQSFCVVLEEHVRASGMDVAQLSEKSGVRFPLGLHMMGEGHEREDWETLCYLCFWLYMSNGSLPVEFVSRMVLGDDTRWTKMLLSTGVLHKN